MNEKMLGTPRWQESTVEVPEKLQNIILFSNFPHMETIISIIELNTIYFRKTLSSVDSVNLKQQD